MRSWMARVKRVDNPAQMMLELLFFIFAGKTSRIMKPTKGVAMRRFWENLKRQAEENPVMALGFGAAFLTAVGKFIDAAGHARGSHAYAKDVQRRIKRDK